jgi:3-O-methylgallate 3,4-dioxygenase
MAKIVLGLGSSHTPMLLAADETLPRFEETDQRIKHRDKEGRPTTYAELVEKADPGMAAMVAPAALIARQNKVRAASAHLSKTLATAKLDTLIVLSDDQDEAYLEDARPTFAIYYGETILNSNEQHEQYRQRFPEWYVKNRQGFFEDAAPRPYPVDAKLAVHLIDWLMDEKNPIAIVPVFLNTYFPPNQPRPRRCYQLGVAIRKAVETYPGEARVGIVASGGLSHFLVDEDFDRAILKACADKNATFLQNLPRHKLHAGSSEILNWVGIAGACEHLDLRWFEYVPGYRTPAGTGTGLGFASWS